MPFVKGDTRINREGRMKGVPNTDVAFVRNTLAQIIATEIPEIHSALAEVRNQNPARYLELLLKTMEYTTPKLMHIKSDVELGEGTIQSIQVIMKNKDQDDMIEIK
jgi:hypothetical protein